MTQIINPQATAVSPETVDSTQSPAARAPAVEITLLSKKVARILSTDGDKTTISSPEPAPPGATVRGHIPGCDSEFQLKVRNCVKKGEFFEIDGRLRNVTRPFKAALLGSSG